MDRIILYFIQKRHNWPDRMLGVFFGVSPQTVHNTVEEVTSKIVEHFVPRLFFLPSPEEVLPFIPLDVKTAFPKALFAGDATHIKTPVPEKYSLNSLSFCVYKWSPTAQFVLCKCSYVLNLCFFSRADELFFLVATLDGRPVGRTLFFGGKAAECQDCVNGSAFVEALIGNISPLIAVLFIFHFFFSSAMGFVPREGFDSETELLLYDGAGTRVRLSHKVAVATPPNRFEDGVRQTVLFFSCFFFSFANLTLRVARKRGRRDNSAVCSVFY